MTNNIRVRIAPSPTGALHIGTARTALFNWLFARHIGGKFILRIEDTDLERSEVKWEKDIISGLRWLGLEWDEGPIADAQNQKSKIKNQNYAGKYGPYRQSERLDIYEKYLKQLLEKGDAYYCSCTKEELEKERNEQSERGIAPKYSGKCRSRKVSEADAQVIRFIIPEEKVQFSDLIRGDIVFDTSLFGDLAIAKGLRVPLYNFAVVIDDFEMKISHVIRGEDHIANTPKQILLQRALGFSTPVYAHLPLILDPDRSKMSKRYSATSLEEYRKAGYLPEALMNFIALLGWHLSDDREILSEEELIQNFDLSRAQKSGAVFNVEKLNWLNAQYIKTADEGRLLEIIKEIFGEEFGNLPLTRKLIASSRERISKLDEFKDINNFFFELPDYDPSLLIWKNTEPERIMENLRVAREILKGFLLDEFDKANLEAKLMPWADTRGRGEVLWPMRAALSGKDKSPGPFEIMDILGKDESLRRLDIALQKLESNN
ncbi:MAG: glutamate--tRNA ligase [bacterium]|nr:glutamate--tRNA ligase [bacterium]